MHIRLALAITALAAPLSAQTCKIDLAAVEARIRYFEPTYGLVLSDIGCDAPTLPAHVLMCNDTNASDATLWRMGRLDDLAWVHAVENATGSRVDLTNPPRDADFLAVRDACTDVACLCGALMDHTSASLGGLSPYPQ